jgi:hypothetical protein
VQDDGSFTLSAPPGRWRLQVNGVPGYIKSVTLGDQEVSPSALDIGPAPPALKVVMGTKTRDVQATISELPPDANSVRAVIWPEDGSQFQQNTAQGAQTSLHFSLHPGHYYGCAVALPQMTTLLQQDTAFRKAVAGHCASLDVTEDGPATVQLPFLAADEIKRLADNLDADAAPAF